MPLVSGARLLLGWLVTSQGPLAPAKVTVAKVEQGPLVASTFGIGTVEARRGYALGPTVASRVLRVLVDQGDTVKAGQLVAELDPVDLDRPRHQWRAGGGTSGEHDPRRGSATGRGPESRPGGRVGRTTLRRTARPRVRQPGSHRRQGARSQCREGRRRRGGGSGRGGTARPRTGAGRCRWHRQAAYAGAAREPGRWGGQRAAGRARHDGRRRPGGRAGHRPGDPVGQGAHRPGRSPEEFAWASRPRSCCAPTRSAPTAGRCSASTW